MASFALSALLALSLSASVRAVADAPTPTITEAPKLAARQASTPLPLTQYTYAYSDVVSLFSESLEGERAKMTDSALSLFPRKQPYKVNPYQYLRGPQSGYNQCNSTTEGPDSQCQTAVLNNASDFCIWGSPTTNELIGNIEAVVVAYCTRSGHGARIIPAGAITGLQWMKTSAYTQVVGYIDQTKVDLQASDYGGELDPHGADLLGNPLGGLVYSDGLPTGNNSTYVQAQEWNNFIGSGLFCFKICDPSVTSPNYCQNIYDLIGCSYNMPASYAAINGTFTSCEGELQDVAGTYTSNGQTYTWSQPSSLPATSTLPWTPRIPASSNCVTYQSSDLFPVASLGYQASAASSSATLTSSSAVATGTSSGASRSGSASTSATRTGSSTSAAASSTSTASAAGNVAVPGFAVLLGALFALF